MADRGVFDDLKNWKDFVKQRYPEKESENKKKEGFRDYRTGARPSVKKFYQLNHQNQTLEFVKHKEKEFCSLNRKTMDIWQAIEFLNELLDDSDPDTNLSQLQHLMQTAEAIRGDGHPRWFILTGLIHDLGKILCLFGEPQWAVVGDTFPVGCRFSEKIVFPEFFESNPDSRVPKYQTQTGIYEKGCGLGQVHMSWGHDEYLYHVVKHHLPDEALYMVRYHSFYPWHKEGEYHQFMNEKDKKMLNWVNAFNPYDLYSKSDNPPDVEKLRPFYEDLIKEYFPKPLNW